jgi:hypothetical protein
MSEPGATSPYASSNQYLCWVCGKGVRNKSKKFVFGLVPDHLYNCLEDGGLRRVVVVDGGWRYAERTGQTADRRFVGTLVELA